MLEWLAAAEEAVLLFLQESVRSDWLSALLVPFTNLGEHGILWISLSLLMLCFRRTRKAGVLGLLALGVCFVLNNLWLKNWFDRPRPYTQILSLLPLGIEPGDASFPSGHTNAAFASAVTYWNTLDIRWLRWLLLGMAVVMAFSRLYVGVHYPTDVLGGALVGTVGSLLVCRLLGPVYDRRFPKASD